LILKAVRSFPHNRVKKWIVAMSPKFFERPLLPLKAAKAIALCFASMLVFFNVPRAPAETPQTPSRSNIRLADVQITDRDGRGIEFAKEAIGDRIVAINFIYTNCRTLCPFQSATFKLLQDRLGDRLDRDVRLISLSLDPSSDTPERLKDFSDNFDPAPGWLWLTGQRQAMDSVLQGLGVSAQEFKKHTPLILVGDAKFGRWTQLNALPSAAQIEQEVNRLWAARHATSTVVQSGDDRAP
jgi:protein SCO1